MHTGCHEAEDAVPSSSLARRPVSMCAQDGSSNIGASRVVVVVVVAVAIAVCREDRVT